MKGVPLRLEIGPEGHRKGPVRACAPAPTVKSSSCPLDQLEDAIQEQLSLIRRQMYDKALARRESMTYEARTFDEMKDIAANKPGLVKAMWCGDEACEQRIKDEAGLSSRCIPFEQEHLSDVCVLLRQARQVHGVLGQGVLSPFSHCCLGAAAKTALPKHNKVQKAASKGSKKAPLGRFLCFAAFREDCCCLFLLQHSFFFSCHSARILL